jgi:hypothetical protein
MERLTQQQEDILLNYLDGTLGNDQLKKLKSEIDGSELLKSRLEELRQVHHILKKNTTLDSPSKNFTQKVMNNLHSRVTVNSLSPKNGLVLLCGVLVATGIALAMLASGFFDGITGTISIPEVAIPAVKEYSVPKIPFNGNLIMKIIIGVNTALAFILLDRTVLRPFFTNRSRHAW